jgi:hypothetical protein
MVTCLPVMRDVLQGFRDERAFLAARDAMSALPVVESPLGRPVFDLGRSLSSLPPRRPDGPLGGALLDRGLRIRHNLAVLHGERDFDALARVSPLDARRV